MHIGNIKKVKQIDEQTNKQTEGQTKLNLEQRFAAKKLQTFVEYFSNFDNFHSNISNNEFK